MLLLLQFLFDHSENFTGKTGHIVPPYNKGGIIQFFFCLEFQKLQKLQIFSKRFFQNATPPSNSYSIILKNAFYLFNHSEKLGIQCHIVPPYTKQRNFYWRNQNFKFFLLRISEIAEITDFFKTLLLLQFLFNHCEIFTGKTRHIVPPYNKGRISNFCLEFQKLQKYCRNYRFLQNATPPFSSYSIILKFLLENLGI